MKKNVMFIIGEMTSGGAERVVNNLCNNLKDKYNITLVVRNIKNADYVPDVNIIEIPNLKLGRVFFKGLKELKKLKRELKIDTAVSFLIKYNAYNYLTKGKEKVIISVRNMLSEQVNNTKKIYMVLYKYIVKRVDLVVNVSLDVKKDTVNNFKSPEKKNIVIPNFCEVESINKLKLEKLPKEHLKLFEGNTIVVAGRYNEQKAQWHAIRAFKKVVEYDSNAKLLLIGKGKLKDYYERLIKDLHLEKNVYLLDFSYNIFSYMYNAKIVLLNSFYEGMPNVLLEAMACGTPIIATDAPGGSKEILDPKNINEERVKDITKGEFGVLIPLLDRKMYEANDSLTYEEEKLADSIIMLLKDEKLREKYKKLSDKRLKSFSKDKMLKKWESIL